MKLLYSVSPLLVIGECIWGVFLTLPTKLVSVLGIKLILDIVESGENLRRIYYVVAGIAVLLIVSRTIAWLFRGRRYH